MSDSRTELKVMSYNIQMTPSIFNLKYNWWNRQPHFESYIREIVQEENPDVIVFQEAFYSKTIKSIRKLSSELDAFRFQTPVLRSELFMEKHRKVSSMGLLDPLIPFIKPEEGHYTLFDKEDPVSKNWDSLSGDFHRISYLTSGVIIVSKYPILHSHGLIYKAGLFPETLGAKGAAFVQIKKNNKLFNIVGTHVQSGDNNNPIRIEQLTQMRDWLFNESNDENGPNRLLDVSIPLIFTGDFNFRYNEDREYILKLLSPDMLNAINILPKDLSELQTTYDTELNLLCNLEENNPSTPKKIIYDYIFLCKDFNGQVEQTQKSIMTKTKTPMNYRFFKFLVIPWSVTTINDLSDHFPIIGSISI